MPAYRLSALLTRFLFPGALLMASASAFAAEFAVQKSPSCMCCDNWAERLEGHGHSVRIIPEDDMADVKRLAGIPEALWSCHTAKVEGYVIEGHVPPEDIARLLRERPDAAGLAVPGMPIGSPGMEQGDHYEAYDVILFRKDGTTEVFAHHE